MKAFTRINLLLLLLVAISGCNTLFFSNNDKICFSDAGETYPCQQQMMTAKGQTQATEFAPVAEKVINRFGTDDHFVSLQDYVQQLAVNLHDQLGEKSINAPVLIREFNATPYSSPEFNQLNQQLTVLLTTELRKMGMPVYATTIQGDNDIPEAGYELQGNLAFYSNKTRIDISIIDQQNQASVSSASTEVPAFVYAKL